MSKESFTEWRIVNVDHPDAITGPMDDDVHARARLHDLLHRDHKVHGTERPNLRLERREVVIERTDWQAAS